MAKSTASRPRQRPTAHQWATRQRVRIWNRLARLADRKTRAAYDRLVDLEQA